MTDTLNIVGCGRLGRTLAHLWHASGTFRIGEILTCSTGTASAAARFIGAGRPIAAIDSFSAAPLWLIATPDSALGATAARLGGIRVVRRGDIVFHCSGALPAAELEPLRSCGAQLASAHPLHSFADPAGSLLSFAGTWCALEGDADALTRLSAAFTRIGAHVRSITSSQKLSYHAGSVIASNYLVALVDLALQAFAHCGLDRADASRMLAPIMRATLDNTLAQGPEAALTGPIARGDVALVREQLAALQALDPELADAYRMLGRATVQVARRHRAANAAALDSLSRILSTR